MKRNILLENFTSSIQFLSLFVVVVRDTGMKPQQLSALVLLGCQTKVCSCYQDNDRSTII